MSTNMTDKINDYQNLVKDSAEGRFPEILEALCPMLQPALSKPMPSGKGTRAMSCPLHQGTTNTNFRFLPSYRMNGACICNTCGRFDGYEIMMKVNCWGWVDCINAVGDYLGIEHPLHNRAPVQMARPLAPVILQPIDPAITARDDARIKAAMNKLWGESTLITPEENLPVACYFANRGLPAVPATCNDVRAHKNIYYSKEEGSFPGYLGLFRDPQGKPIALHRGYVAKDGSGKAKVAGPIKITPENPSGATEGTTKKTMEIPSGVTMTGGAVRIDAKPRKVLVAGEGLESSYAGRTLLGLPTWSCLTAGLLGALVVPASVDIVIFLTDKDRSGRGQLEVNAAIERLKAQGKIGVSFLPPFEIPPDEKSVDWADVVHAYGWRQAQKESFTKEILMQLGKALKQMGLTWRDAYADD